MANTIITKNDSTASNVPAAGEMVEGELAINVTDQKLYSKDATTVFEVAPAQTDLTGISDTMANFDATLSDGAFMYIGDAPTSHTHSLIDVTDITALAAEVNLLDLGGLTAGWVLSADTASSASWKAPTSGSVAAGDITAGDLISTVLPYFATDTTNLNYKIPFISTSGAVSGNYSMYMDTTAAPTYNPSTNTLAAPSFAGGGTGITSFNGSNVTAGSVGALVGGTGQTTWTQGDVLYCSATNVLSKLAKGASGTVLTMTATVPSWSAAGFTPKAAMFVGAGNPSMSGSTAFVTVDLTTEYYDDESNYSLSADIITVTDAGTYLISYTYTYHPTAGATNDSVICQMTKNGTGTVLTASRTQSLIYKSNTRPSQVCNTFLASLAASDTVRLRQANETGTTQTESGIYTNVTMMRVA